MTTKNKPNFSVKASNKLSQVNTPATAYQHTGATPLHVLITRPKDKSLELANLLNQQSIANTIFPLFNYQALATSSLIEADILSANIIIFVSVSAVNFANSSLSDNKSLTNILTSAKASETVHTTTIKTICAVGQATAKSLHELGIQNVFSPDAGQEHSEGLLKLPQLSNIKGKSVLIVRGNGGRELLANALSDRGANVRYLESYQRVWHNLENNCVEQWFAQQINCIVVTSNDILLTLYKHLQQTAKTASGIDDFWQNQCLWVVVSERIEKSARDLGLVNVINSHGANSKKLCKTLQALATA